MFHEVVRLSSSKLSHQSCQVSSLCQVPLQRSQRRKSKLQKALRGRTQWGNAQETEREFNQQYQHWVFWSSFPGKHVPPTMRAETFWADVEMSKAKRAAEVSPNRASPGSSPTGLFSSIQMLFFCRQMHTN